MPTISTPGYSPITPDLVLGYQAARPGRNIVHNNIDPAATTTSVTLAVAEPRAGALVLLFGDQDAAHTALDLLAKRLVFDFSHEQRHTWSMRFIVAGDLEIEQDEDTANRYTVTVPFREL